MPGHAQLELQEKFLVSVNEFYIFTALFFRDLVVRNCSALKHRW
jgi:hypothetical protein